ncbi:MAG: hypothetical protein H6737_03055 [Alphaproteobacteria bacterium]|nr:hypothetical protein [Alphaproteobacteria bacterium]
MTTWILSLIVPFIIAVLWHGFSLQIASVLAGEEAPRFTRAVWVSWLGGLLGGGSAILWTYSFGLIVSLFISAWLATAIGFGIHLFVVGATYKRGLRFSTPTALGVAGIHMILSYVVNAVLAWLTLTYLWA